jgi:hypothetical protein
VLGMSYGMIPEMSNRLGAHRLMEYGLKYCYYVFWFSLLTLLTNIAVGECE